MRPLGTCPCPLRTMSKNEMLFDASLAKQPRRRNRNNNHLYRPTSLSNQGQSDLWIPKSCRPLLIFKSNFYQSSILKNFSSGTL
ncbi:hypothetical protein Bca4012_054259 [Brassica carinata]